MSGEDRSGKYVSKEPNDDVPPFSNTPGGPPSYTQVIGEEKKQGAASPSQTRAVDPNANNPNVPKSDGSGGLIYSTYNTYPPPQQYPPQQGGAQPYPPQQGQQPYPPQQGGAQPYPAPQQGQQPYPPQGQQPYPPPNGTQPYPYSAQPYPSQQPYPPPSGQYPPPDGQPPGGYVYSVPAYPVYPGGPTTTVAAYPPMSGQPQQAYVAAPAYVAANQNATTVSVTSDHRGRDQGLVCGIGLAWILFIIGWFTIFAWAAGSFFVCLGDRRERRGGYANLIALIIVVIIIVVASVN